MANTKELALENIKKARAFILGFVGKKGYNPYLHESNILKPLEDGVNKDDPAFIKKACELKHDAEPTIEWAKMNSIDYSNIVFSEPPASLPQPKTSEQVQQTAETTK